MQLPTPLLDDDDVAAAAALLNLPFDFSENLFVVVALAFVTMAALVAASKTSSTPIFRKAEHS